MLASRKRRKSSRTASSPIPTAGAPRSTARIPTCGFGCGCHLGAQLRGLSVAELDLAQLLAADVEPVGVLAECLQVFVLGVGQVALLGGG